MAKAIKLMCRVVFSRTLVTILLLLIQILVLFGAFRFFEGYMEYIYGGFTFLSAIMIIYIVNKEGNPAFKLAWLLPVTIFPVLGAFLYLFIVTNIGNIGLKSEVERSEADTEPFLHTLPAVKKQLQKEEPSFQQLSHYIDHKTAYPTYQNTQVTYYSLGEEKFQAILEELEKAKVYIFLEYFIVERGKMWNAILAVLERKAKEGVEVRVMYDGMCSLLLLPYKYPQQLRAKGIRAKMFSPIKPALSTHQNNRDHRKILVIDGKVAFNGGVNLADEYINEKEVFGHWKDTAVKLEGDAVHGFTAMFLQLWNVSEEIKENYEYYLKREVKEAEAEPIQGYVIPFGDGPTNAEDVAENVYMDMLYTAKRYVHIMSPYLILDNEMLTALTYAAKRGVEVKLLLPHIPDKKTAFATARTFYPQLLKAGVRLYEYTPGFVHAKMFISDDEKAVVGTINLDYRSLYLHFECGTYLYQLPVVAEIEQDFQKTIENSMEVDMEYFRKISPFWRLAGRLLRLVAPLM